MSQPLDPQIAAIVRAQAERGAPRAFAGGIEAARTRFRTAVEAAPADPGLPPLAEVRDLPGAPVRARLYVAEHPVSDALVVWFHGGGYALGNLDLFDETARRLCAGTGARVVAVGYRQAPEHRFPAPFDDALAATRWVMANAATLGGRAGRVIVGGESSGGNLAASTAIRLRDQGVKLLGQFLVVPGVNLARTLPDDAVFPMLSAADLADIRDNLMPPGMPLDTFPPSPLHAADLTGLAPAIIVTAGHDPLAAEAQAYAARLDAARVAVTRLHFADMHHQFFGFAAASAGAARAVTATCAALRTFIATQTQDDQETAE